MMTRPGPRILVFGDVIDDIIVTPEHGIRRDTDTPASIVRRPGGSAANSAAWFAWAGCHVDFIGRVNVVDLARHSAYLVESRVSPHLLGEPDLPTGAIVVLVDDGDGTRTMLTQRGANAALSPADVTPQRLAAANHLHFTGYSVFGSTRPAAFVRLIERAHELGLTVSVDPGSSGFIADHGPAEFLAAVAGADILVPNLDEGVALTGTDSPNAILDTLLGSFPLVALTLGAAGVLVGTRDGIRVTARSTAEDPVDATGAGDAFCAAFIASYLGVEQPVAQPETAPPETARIERAVDRGLRAAATAVRRVGARPGPTAPNTSSDPLSRSTPHPAR
jgi:sugar/nucleoside kinase (ribokinase family)